MPCDMLEARFGPFYYIQLITSGVCAGLYLMACAMLTIDVLRGSIQKTLARLEAIGPDPSVGPSSPSSPSSVVEDRLLKFPTKN